MKSRSEIELASRIRSETLKAIREFFETQSFLEVDTPVIVPYPDPEPTFDLFSTDLKTQCGTNFKGYLTTSPEFYMKRIIAEGISNIFQLTKSFRNGETNSSKHNPEFTILEWYRANVDYEKIMEDVEKLLLHIVNSLQKTGIISGKKGCFEYAGKVFDFNKPWKKISVTEAFETYAGINEDVLLNANRFIKACEDKGYNIENATFQELFDQVFLNEIEPQLGKNEPTFLYDYLASQAALARKKPSDDRYAERFEFYIAGIELGNAFSELTDVKEQKARFLAQNKERVSLGKTDVGIDEPFLEAVAKMPPTAGIAVGVDRLLLLFMDSEDLRDVILFPADEIFS